ncbi:MAG: molybdopterin molybdotransferase MoeA, partial [Firmicutes bacterium]|nr:molybdopterin molybdotransferase MoeA [Bacillota bacterium]
STVDGYALRAKDAFGASEGLPAYLTVVGEVAMGEAALFSLGPGEAARVATGGMLPPGADAVAMLEYVELLDDRTIGVLRSVAPGQDMIARGEDIRAGELILGAGRRLRPQDLGALAGVGRTVVKVYRWLRVAVISTGDEVVPPEVEPGPGQVRDINSAALVSQLQAEGCQVEYKGIVKDDAATLRRVMLDSWDCDVILLSGGSSVGTRDVTAEVINSLGKPGVLVHGVAIRPGKPTVLAVAGGKPIFGLPGHPVSAMIVFDVIVRPGIRRLMGLPPEERWRGRIWARLTRNYASGGGREEYLRVTLQEKAGEILAEPVLGKSG